MQFFNLKIIFKKQLNILFSQNFLQITPVYLQGILQDPFKG